MARAQEAGGMTRHWAHTFLGVYIPDPNETE